MCAFVCNEGCFCDTGFMRDENGICQPKNKCPPLDGCPPDEEWKSCSSKCEATCDVQLPVCDKACGAMPACQCAEGFVRNEAGICINPKGCPASNPGKSNL